MGPTYHDPAERSYRDWHSTGQPGETRDVVGSSRFELDLTVAISAKHSSRHQNKPLVNPLGGLHVLIVTPVICFWLQEKELSRKETAPLA